MALLAAEKRRRKTPARVRLIRAEEDVRVPATGAVGSVQEAEVTMPVELVEQLSKPEYLERPRPLLLRHLDRATLGLIRIVYTENVTRRCADHPPPAAAHLRAPDYKASADHGCVTWRIARGPVGLPAGPRRRLPANQG